MKQRNISKHFVLATALNVTEGAVSRWCQGGPMTLANIVALCEFLDISADWLLMERGDIDQHRYRQTGGICETSLAGVCERARPHLMRFLQEATRLLSDPQ